MHDIIWIVFIYRASGNKKEEKVKMEQVDAHLTIKKESRIKGYFKNFSLYYLLCFKTSEVMRIGFTLIFMLLLLQKMAHRGA